MYVRQSRVFVQRRVMILVKFLKIEFIDTATERYSALVMLQATWREPKLDKMVRIDSIVNSDAFITAGRIARMHDLWYVRPSVRPSVCQTHIESYFNHNHSCILRPNNVAEFRQGYTKYTRIRIKFRKDSHNSLTCELISLCSTLSLRELKPIKLARDQSRPYVQYSHHLKPTGLVY